MSFRTETDKPVVRGAIKDQENVKLEIVTAEGSYWAHKDELGNKILDPDGQTVAGKRTQVLKLALKIVDDGVEMNVDGTRPGMINVQINMEKHPYWKDGELKYMARYPFYQLESALGFEPNYVGENGETVEPHITKTGRKVCPKGASQQINSAFADAYFDSDGTPKFGAFEGKTVYADVTLVEDAEYGDKNEIKAFKTLE